MQIRRVLVFRKYNKKESGCPSVTAAFHNGAVCLPGSDSQQILDHECQQLMKSTVPRLKRPFIPGVPGWGLAWTYQGAARVNTARLAASPDPHSSRGPPVAARSGPLTMLAFSRPVSPHLPNLAKPWQLWVLPTQSPSVLPAARHIPKSLPPTPATTPV